MTKTDTSLVTEVRFNKAEHGEWAAKYAKKTKTAIASLEGDVLRVRPEVLDKYQELRGELMKELAEMLDMHATTELIRKWVSGLDLGVEASRVTAMTDYLDGKETSPCVLLIEFSEYPGEFFPILKSRVSQNDKPGVVYGKSGKSAKRTIGDALEKLNSDASYFAFFMDTSSPFYDARRSEGVTNATLDLEKLSDINGQVAELSRNSVEAISAVRTFLDEKRGGSALPVGLKKAA